MRTSRTPATSLELRLSEPSIWPFCTITGPAEICIARGAALPFIRMRAQCLEKDPADILLTSLSGVRKTPHKSGYTTLQQNLQIRSLLNPADPEGDVREWLQTLHLFLLQGFPRQRILGLSLRLHIESERKTTKGVHWLCPWT
jgi:hypothetical protein